MKSNEKFIQKKQNMVNQITSLITREGYENLTVRRICKELEISTGTFYHYFPDKDDLIKVFFTDIDAYFEHMVSNDFTNSEADNLLLFCESYGRYSCKNGVETCRRINIAPLQTEDHTYLEEDRAISQVLYGIFTRGCENGQFHLTLSPDEITRMFLVLIRGYSIDWVKHNGNYDLVQRLHQFCECFLSAIIAK